MHTDPKCYKLRFMISMLLAMLPRRILGGPGVDHRRTTQYTYLNLQSDKFKHALLKIITKSMDLINSISLIQIDTVKKLRSVRNFSV